jgi:hypothetical protein
MMSEMKYLAIPVLGLVFGLFFAYSAFAAETGTICTMQYAPVCAAKQVQCVRAPCYPVYQTYGNSCVANADGATIIHQGECTSTETGPIQPSTEAYTPPAGCTAWFDGCNTCQKTPNGTACTERACFAPAAGYCTAYASTATPEVIATTTPVVGTTTLPVEPSDGFFHRLWNWFKHLLHLPF